MKNQKIKYKNFDKKLRFWTRAFLIVLALILGGISYRMTIGGKKFRIAGNVQNTQIIDIPAERGVIYDRNGEKLTDSLIVKNFYYNGMMIPQEDFHIINQELSKIFKINNILSSIKSGEASLLAEELTPQQIEKVEDLEYPQFTMDTEKRRHYPHGKLASSLIGFVDNNGNPQSGVELSLNNILSGEPGKSIFHKNMKGEIIPFEEKISHPPKNGEEVILTVDEKIQLAVENIGKEAMDRLEAKSISIIVTNPQTGEILAMQDFPEYNLNFPYEMLDYKHLFLKDDKEKQLEKKTDENFQEELEETQSFSMEDFYELWKNKSINLVYEPGSVFKMITTAAALEEHTSTDKSKYFCDGFVRDIPGFLIRCYSWMDPHGEETLEESLVNSCNPAYVKIARDLGKETFYQYIKSFGFGELTNINLLGEEKGNFLESSEKMGDAHLATLSYGYGIGATPIQMIMASNACINGGYLLEPQITLEDFEASIEISPIERRQVISETTSKELSKMLQTVIEDGAKNVRIPGYRIGGKSGTAMKFEEGEYNSKNVVSSFYGFFPVEDPEYSVLVLVENPLDGLNGTAAAGPIVRDLFHHIIRYQSIEPDNEYFENPEKKDIIIPDLVGMTLKDATSLIRNLNLKVNIHTATADDWIIITNQFPEAGETVSKNSIIFLEADETSSARVRVPELKNFTIRQLENKLEKINLNYTTNNYGNERVVETLPEAGALVLPNTTIEVIFDEKELLEDSQENDRDDTVDNENNTGNEKE